MTWSIKQYITQDEYLANGGQALNAPNDTPTSVNETYTLLLRIASQETDWLTGGKIGWDLTKLGSWYDTVNGREVSSQERQDGVRQAVLLVANNLVERGLSWLRGASSLSVGGTYSVSQQNPNQPDYIPPPITRQLRSIGLYDTLEVIQVNPFLPKSTQTTPTPTPPPPGNWNAQKQFETYESQFINSQTIGVSFNQATEQVEWRFLGTIPAEWNADKQYDALKTQLVAGSNITITPNDNLKTFTFASTGGGGDPTFGSGQPISSVYIRNQEPTDLLTKAMTESKVAVKLDTATFTDFKDNTYTPKINDLGGRVSTNETDITNLKETRLNRTFDNANLPQTFNNKFIKGTSTGGVEPADAPTPELDNIYPIVKEMAQAGTNITFRWQDDIPLWTINADTPRFADNSVVGDYSPIGDGTQIVAMNQFDEGATGKFLKKIDQGWEWSEIQVSSTFKTGQKVSETAIGNTNANDLQTKANVDSKISPVTRDITALQTGKLNKIGYDPTTDEGKVVVCRNGVLVLESQTFLTPEYILDHLPPEFFDSLYWDQLQGNDRKYFQADTFSTNKGGSLALPLHTDTTYSGLSFRVEVLRSEPQQIYYPDGDPNGEPNLGVLVCDFACYVVEGRQQKYRTEYVNVCLNGFAKTTTLTPANFAEFATISANVCRIKTGITHIQPNLCNDPTIPTNWNVLVLPPTLAYIGESAFEAKYLEQALVIPPTCHTIENRAFFNTHNAKVIFDNVIRTPILTTIGNDAFNELTTTTEINFASPHLRVVGTNAFYATPLTSITFSGTPPATSKGCAVYSFGARAFHNAEVSVVNPTNWQTAFRTTCKGEWMRAFD